MNLTALYIIIGAIIGVPIAVWLNRKIERWQTRKWSERKQHKENLAFVEWHKEQLRMEKMEKTV